MHRSRCHCNHQSCVSVCYIWPQAPLESFRSLGNFLVFCSAFHPSGASWQLFFWIADLTNEPYWDAHIIEQGSAFFFLPQAPQKAPPGRYSSGCLPAYAGSSPWEWCSPPASSSTRPLPSSSRLSPLKTARNKAARMRKGVCLCNVLLKPWHRGPCGRIIGTYWL